MAGYIGTRAAVASPGTERKKTFAITTTTTNLTGLSYTPGFVHVYHNGIRLVDSTDYTATDGSTITLTTAAENGDEVVVVSYGTFSPADTYTKSEIYTKTEADDRYVNASGDTMTGKLVTQGGFDIPTAHIGFNRNIANGAIYNSENHAFQITQYDNTHPTPNTLAFECYNGAGGSLGNAIEIRGSIGGAVRFPLQPGFRSGSGTFDGTTGIAYNYASSSGTIGNSFTYRNSGHFNTSTGRFTAPISGKYLICATYGKDDGVERRSIGWLFINGSNRGEWVESWGQYDDTTGAIVEYLEVNDYVEFGTHTAIIYNRIIASIDFLG